MMGDLSLPISLTEYSNLPGVAVALSGNAYTTTLGDLSSVLRVTTSGADATITLVAASAAGINATQMIQKTNTDQYRVIITDGVTELAHLFGSGDFAIPRSDDGVSWVRNILGPSNRRALPYIPQAAVAGMGAPFLQSSKGIIKSGHTDENGIPWFLGLDRSTLNVFETDPSTSTTAPSARGGQVSTSGTISHPAVSPGTYKGEAHRTQFDTGIASATAAGMRNATSWFIRGAAAGHGGFYARIVFALEVDDSGGACFVGLAAPSQGAMNGNPTSMLNMIGYGYNASDTLPGNWFQMNNDGSGSATHVDTGQARNTTDLLMAEFGCKPNDSGLWTRFCDIDTNTVILDWTQFTADIPANNISHEAYVYVYTSAVVADMAISCAKMVEYGQLGIRV